MNALIFCIKLVRSESLYSLLSKIISNAGCGFEKSFQCCRVIVGVCLRRKFARCQWVFRESLFLIFIAEIEKNRCNRALHF